MMEKVNTMKFIVNGEQEAASIDLQIDPGTGMCRPMIDTLGYRISGPNVKIALVKDDSTDGLRLALELPDITNAAILVEKADVKKLKGLMNKDAIKFMVKALM